MTPIEITDQFHGETLAARSTDGLWEYQRVAGGLWSVTHTPTGRRYWTVGLHQARTETGDGTAVARLEVGHDPRPGKPMTEGERSAIRGELSARDLGGMLDQVRPRAAGVVTEVLGRIGLPADYLERRTVAPSCASKLLGAVYGAAPEVWVDALRAVRPDLVPPHLS